MKILVADDSQKQRIAAEVALKEHEVVVSDTFASTAELLKPEFNEERFRTMLVEAGLPVTFRAYDDGATEEQNAKYYELQDQAYDPCDFDVVLTDLMMPAERDGLGRTGLPFVGDPMPYGFTVALLALKSGVPQVAIVSNGNADDGNHHNHPILNSCDRIEGTIVENRLTVFAGYNCPNMNEEKMPSEDKPHRIKDWATVLEKISG